MQTELDPSHISTRFVDEALDLVGTPFHHQGRTDDGVDCLGLIVLAARRAGVTGVEDHVPDYVRRPDPEVLRLGLNKRMRRVSWRDRRNGDVLLMKEGDLSAHLGILEVDPPDHGREYIIHAYAKARKVIRERMLPGVRTIMAVYRLHGQGD